VFVRFDDENKEWMEGGRISVQYNYDATTSPDDPAPRVDCSSHFLLPAG
jgi:hypothetical protein